ncbi:MAG: S41 family peptidase [Blastocatellia bacterium]
MFKINRVFLLTALIFVLGAVDTLFAQKRKPAAKGSRTTVRTAINTNAARPEVKRRIETFEKVWQTLNDNYFDPTFNNLNWYKIKEEYAPRVLAVKTDAALHGLLEQMINRLQRSHLAIIDPEVYQTINAAKKEAKEREFRRSERSTTAEKDGGEEEEDLHLDGPLTQYGIGVDLRLIENKFVITRLEKDSAAEYEGLKTGYAIEAVNDVSLSLLLFKLRVMYPEAKNIRRYLPKEIVGEFLNGEKDSYVTVKYLDANDKENEIQIRRERLKSETVTIGENFPESQLRFEAFSINDDVGLIRFDHFAIQVIAKFCDALTKFRDKKAIIVDFRGNTGGSLAVMIGLAGMLASEPVDLGTSMYRTGPEQLISQPKANNFKGSLVFLVDDLTVSAAEMFTSSLQESKRAILVGDKTAGETLPAVSVSLPTGATMLYPIANYRSGKGKYLEGNGVTPDHLISLDRKSLLEGRDIQLETALRVIKDEKTFAKTSTNLSPSVFKGPVPGGLSINSGAAPPPPPKAAPRDLGTVTVTAPPPPKILEKPPTRDQEALQVIGEFSKAVGGIEGYNKIKTYSMTGKVEVGVRGIKQTFDFGVYRESPNKYAEITTSPSIGEVRDIRDGKSIHVKADYGAERKLPFPVAVTEFEPIAPIALILEKENVVSLAYLGIFEREGRKVHVIEGKDKEGDTFAATFDVGTKMLASFTGLSLTISYGDFRKIGDLMLPFVIERGQVIIIRFDDIKINNRIDPATFQHKDQCFDKAN